MYLNCPEVYCPVTCCSLCPSISVHLCFMSSCCLWCPHLDFTHPMSTCIPCPESTPVLILLQASELVNGSPSSSDTSTFTVTQVDVTVLDENDNSPEFDKSEYSVTIPEDMVDRTPLATPIIEVTDRDQVWVSSRKICF